MSSFGGTVYVYLKIKVDVKDKKVRLTIIAEGIESVIGNDSISGRKSQINSNIWLKIEPRLKKIQIDFKKNLEKESNDNW